MAKVKVVAPWDSTQTVELDYTPSLGEMRAMTENGPVYDDGAGGTVSAEDYLRRQTELYAGGQGLYDAGFLGKQADGTYLVVTNTSGPPTRMTEQQWREHQSRYSADNMGYGKGSLGRDLLDVATDLMPGLIQAAPFALAGAGMGGAFGPGTGIMEGAGAAGAAEAAPTFNAGGMSFGSTPSGVGTNSLSEIAAQVAAEAPASTGGGINFLEQGVVANPGSFPVTGDGSWSSALGSQTYTPGIDVPGVDMSKTFPVSGVNNATIPATSVPALDTLSPTVNMMDVLKQTGAAQTVPASTTAPAPTAADSIKRILEGNGTKDDFLSVLGKAAPALIGAFASNQQADALRDLSEKNRAERAPFLATANSWLSNPTAYAEGPGQAGLNGTLKALSAKFGNPIGSGTALQIASETGARNWQDAVTGMANLGLGGADTRANIDMNAIKADGNVWGALGGGVADVFNKPRSLADIFKELKGAGISINYGQPA